MDAQRLGLLLMLAALSVSILGVRWLRRRRRSAMAEIRNRAAAPGAAFPIPPLGGWAIALTTTGGKPVQQDAVSCLETSAWKAIALADGVSGTPGAERAARMAVHVLLEELRQTARRGGIIDLQALSRGFQKAHREVVGGPPSGEPFSGIAPQTTLIAVVETPDRILIAYCGDGAVIVSSGSLRWATSLLFPQVDFQQAGALRGIIGGSDDPQPTLISLPRAAWPDGLVVVLGTDGALPPGESLRPAWDLLLRIRELFGAGQDPTCFLEEWLRSLESDDNRSLGLLITEEALRLWRNPDGCGAVAGGSTDIRPGAPGDSPAAAGGGRPGGGAPGASKGGSSPLGAQVISGAPGASGRTALNSYGGIPASSWGSTAGSGAGAAGHCRGGSG